MSKLKTQKGILLEAREGITIPFVSKLKGTLRFYGKEGMDEATIKQIITLSKSKAYEGQNIAIMQDGHYGKGSCVGFTSTFTDKIIVNTIGVDIGCGVTTLIIDNPEMINWITNNLKQVNDIIKETVPMGSNVHQHIFYGIMFLGSSLLINKLAKSEKQYKRWLHSIGTLGGGNHFIEIGKDSVGKLYLTIHSGSRSLGTFIADKHQKIAETNFIKRKPTKEELSTVEPKDRQEFIANFDTRKVKDSPEKGLEYLVGSQVDDYLKDMKIAQNYARRNRNIMIFNIIQELKKITNININNTLTNTINTTHNYIDIKNKIIRKGSIEVRNDKKVIIPLNMRDGIILAKGKGTKESNYSGPHGAGRVMGRMQAKRELTMDQYKNAMKDIASWSINEHTLDEAPQAYKPKDLITKPFTYQGIEVLDIIKPILNIKDDSPSSYGRKKKKVNND